MSNMIEMRDHISSLTTYIDRLFIQKTNLQKAEAEMKILLQCYEKERRDVEKIKNESFSKSMFRLVHQYNAKLDKEVREEMEAKINYDRAVIRLEALRKEVAELESRVASFREEGNQYTDELEKRRCDAKNNLSTKDGQRFEELEKIRDSIIARKTEVEEALSAARKAELTAVNVYNELDGARTWATIDALSGKGVMTHIEKFSRMDRAQGLFNRLSSEITTLNAALKDVGEIPTPELIEVTSAQRTFDYWFDNILTDWTVRDQITNNADKMNQFLKAIEEVVDHLITKGLELDKELESNENETENLLISSCN